MTATRLFTTLIAGIYIACLTLAGCIWPRRDCIPPPYPSLYIEQIVSSKESKNDWVKEVMFFRSSGLQYYQIVNNSITNFTTATPPMINKFQDKMEKFVIKEKTFNPNVFFKETSFGAVQIASQKKQDYNSTWYHWHGLFNKLPKTLQLLYEQIKMDDTLQHTLNINNNSNHIHYYLRACLLTETQFNELKPTIPTIEMPKRNWEHYNEEDADIPIATKIPYQLFPIKKRTKPLYFMIDGRQPGDKFLLKNGSIYFLIETFPNASFQNPQVELQPLQGE